MDEEIGHSAGARAAWHSHCASRDGAGVRAPETSPDRVSGEYAVHLRHDQSGKLFLTGFCIDRISSRQNYRTGFFQIHYTPRVNMKFLGFGLRFKSPHTRSIPEILGVASGIPTL